MPSNARHHPREEVTLRVDYMDAQGRGGLGLATNLSYTGIALTSLSRPLQVGDTLVLDQREKWPVMIKFSGKNKLYARAQMDAARKAFVITGHVRSRREEPMNGHIAE